MQFLYYENLKLIYNIASKDNEIKEQERAQNGKSQSKN